MEMLSGGEILLRSLQDEGVNLIFGYPGGAVLHIYDAHTRQNGIRHILVRHEQAAAHAADGYGRSTGKPGVVLVTSGPGATNTLTGIATAYMDSVPLIVISGQVPRAAIGSDFFQETDMIGASRPMVKHSYLVTNAEDIPLIVKNAFHLAVSGRPGPVVIDVPKDVTDPNIKFAYEYPDKPSLRSYRSTPIADTQDILKLTSQLCSAKRPIIYAGGGVVQGNASENLTKLARHLKIPVTNTLMGLGSFPGTDPQFLGMLGLYGSYASNMAMHNSDFVLAIGARFDDRVTNNPKHFCPDATIAQIDIDPASIDKIIKTDISITGLAEPVLAEMLEHAKTIDPKPRQLNSLWWKNLLEWQKAGDEYSKVDRKGLLKPQHVMECLYEATSGEAYVTSDVGQHQMFAAHLYKFNSPRQWINSGGLGTMGFGLPAAMGVQFAHPDATVACVTSEGSVQMNIQELSCCAQYNLPIKIINLNNQALGMVRQWQDMEYEGRHSASTYQDSLPNFVRLVESYGHVAFKIRNYEELESRMQEAFELTNRLVFLDIDVDQNEHNYPMHVKGERMCDMFLSKTKRT